MEGKAWLFYHVNDVSVYRGAGAGAGAGGKGSSIETMSLWPYPVVCVPSAGVSNIR